MAVNNAVEDCLPEGDRLRELRPFLYTDGAQASLRAMPERGRLPDALLLDTEARGSRDAAPGLARTAKELLARLTDEMPDLPVVLATHSAGADFDIEAILRKQVWIWDTTADGDAGQRLATVLHAAVTRPPERHLCATVRFARDAEYLSLEENGLPHMTSRPLLPSDEARRRLHLLAEEKLEDFVNLPDIARCWDKFGEVGQRMFLSLFGNSYDALLGSGPPVTIEWRFEMSPGVLDERFGLPLELLNRGDVRNGFLCRLLPMARRVGAVRRPEAPPPGSAKPHILFVDAGDAVGKSEVLDERELRPTGFSPLQEPADQQYRSLELMEQDGHCSVERWTLAAFKRDFPGTTPETSFLEALRRRLQAPRLEHRAPDILHFSGHGITPRGSDTRLVLPGTKKSTVELLRIDRLAEWLPRSVRLVFLGACQSVSASTAASLHTGRRCSVVGFRWEIKAERIPAFVEQFYRAHLAGQRSVAAAYRTACHETADDIHTVWASAVALTAD